MLRDYERDLEENPGEFGTHTLTRDAPLLFNQIGGRAGTAIWRAQRSVSRNDLAAWLTTSTDRSYDVLPPGWTLRMPDGWHSYQFSRSAVLPPPLATYVEHGRVLRIDHLDHSALWPLSSTRDPIARFDRIVAGAGAGQVDPLDLAEASMVSRVDAHGEVYLGSPWTTAETAHALGFISVSERDTLIREARESTEGRIRQAIRAAARRGGRLGTERLGRLSAAAEDPERFAQLAKEHYLRFWISRPTWSLQVNSIAAALATGATDQQLEWLGQAWLDLLSRHLERDMHEAWTNAFHKARLSGSDDDDEDLELEDVEAVGPEPL